MSCFLFLRCHSESIRKLKNDKDEFLLCVQSTLTKAINQVQKARKALSNSNGKYPDDSEIAKFTGLSIAKIISASKCLRVVGSIDQKIGENINIKYMVRLNFVIISSFMFIDARIIESKANRLFCYRWMLFFQDSSSNTEPLTLLSLYDLVF